MTRSVALTLSLVVSISAESICGSSSGPVKVDVGSKELTLYCEKAADGDWLLVQRRTERFETLDQFYPSSGLNYAGLEAYGEDWASLSAQDLHDLWFSLASPVLKTNVKEIGNYGRLNAKWSPWTFYLQRAHAADFDPFHGIVDTREWGAARTDYLLCGKTECYDATSKTVTYEESPAKNMNAFTNGPGHVVTRAVGSKKGQEIQVTDHGIPWDYNGGCCWVSSNYVSNGGAFCSNGHEDEATRGKPLVQLFVSAPPAPTTTTETSTTVTTTTQMLFVSLAASRAAIVLPAIIAIQHCFHL